MAYFCADQPERCYRRKERWSRIMDNVTEACIQENVLLVSLDSFDVYGPVEGLITETTTYNSCSRSGEVRAGIALQLQSEMQRKNIRAIIARAADLYGPHAQHHGRFCRRAVRNWKKGKRARWMGSRDEPHSCSYTRDCAKAHSILAESQFAQGQLWHLPTSNPGLTGRQWAQLMDETLGANPNNKSGSLWAHKLWGYIDKVTVELYEAGCQPKRVCQFDSSKFEGAFNFVPTSYRQGLKETLDFWNIL